MGVYGPFNASLNTVVKVAGIDVNADRVFVDNQSKYTLAVGFTPTQPSAVLTLYGHPWYGEVPPGGKTIPIPRSAYNEQFPGYFWVLALDPLSPTRAYSGTVSANVVFFVLALVPGEPSPPDTAIPQAVDASSQQRVIALNYGAISRAKQSLTISATGLQNTYTLAGIAGTPLNPNAPGSPGSFDWIGYLNYLDMYADVDSYELHWVLVSNDTSGAPQFSGEIWRGRVTPSAPIERSFHVTPTLAFSLVANTATIQAQLFIDQLSAAGGTLVFTSGWTVDFLSGVVVPAIGQGSSIGFQSAGGAVF